MIGVLFKPWFWGACAIAGIFLWGANNARLYNKERQAFSEYKLKQAEDAQKRNDEKQEKVAGVDQGSARKIEAARVAGDALRRDARRVRDAAAAPVAIDNAAPSCAAYAERIASLQRIIGEGAELVAESAARVGELTEKVEGLQEYARACK